MAKQHADRTIEKLKDYLTSEEGTVYLTDYEEQLLRMIMMAHNLFQSRQYTTWQITRMISHCFSCSDHTAQTAMRDAQIIFAARIVYNRDYMAAMHVDELIQEINAAREREDWDLMHKLLQEKTKAIGLLPAETSAKDIPPAVINFNLFKETVAPNSLPSDQAMILAQQYLEQLHIPEAEIIEDDHS